MRHTNLRTRLENHRPQSFVIKVSDLFMTSGINCESSLAASVIRMFKSAVGEETFRKALESYFSVKWVITWKLLDVMTVYIFFQPPQCRYIRKLLSSIRRCDRSGSGILVYWRLQNLGATSWISGHLRDCREKWALFCGHAESIFRTKVRWRRC